MSSGYDRFVAEIKRIDDEIEEKVQRRDRPEPEPPPIEESGEPPPGRGLKVSKNGHVPPAKPKARTVEIYTLQSLQSQELSDPKVIVPDLVLEGFNLYAGKFKTGKSFFVLNLAAAVASGGKALGAFQVDGGDVLYLALEDTPRRLKKRALLQLQGSQWPANAHIAHQWPLVGQGCLRALRKWLDEHPNARLIIIDTLKKIRPIRNGGRSAYDDDYDFVSDLKEIADEYEIGMLGLTHTRKAEAEDVFDTINASTGLGASADTIVVWERKRGTPYVKLHVTGRDVDEEKVDDTALVLQWDKDIASWKYVGGAKEALITDERKDIIKVMQEAGKPVGPREIALFLNKNEATVRKLLEKMLDREEIQRVGYGKYSPSPPIHTVHTDHTEEKERGEWWTE